MVFLNEQKKYKNKKKFFFSNKFKLFNFLMLKSLKKKEQINFKTIKLTNLIVLKFICSFFFNGMRGKLNNLFFKNYGGYKYFVKKNLIFLALLHVYKKIKISLKLKKYFKSGKLYEIPMPLLFDKKIIFFNRYFLKNFIKNCFGVKAFLSEQFFLEVFKFISLTRLKYNSNSLFFKNYNLFSKSLDENYLFLKLNKQKKRYKK